MTNSYETAWKTLRHYVKGLPLMLDLMPIPEGVIAVASKEPLGVALNTTTKAAFKQVLGLMEEQEAILGLSLDSSHDALLDILSKAKPTDSLQDLVNALGDAQAGTHPKPNEAQDLETYANSTSAEERIPSLLDITKEAARLNYTNMRAMHSSRSLVVVPASEGFPVIGSIFVAGETELHRLMEFAGTGHKMTFDSRIMDDIQGEN